MASPSQNPTAPAPMVSIILPVFNAAEFLPPLLASLRNQSESSLEIIAVNDGSTDGSLSLLREAAIEDPRIRIIEQVNKGQSAAQNEGLRQASGRWITFADSDDWLAPELISVWLQRAEALQVDMLVGNYFRFSIDPEEGGKIPELTSQPWNEVISGPEWIVRCQKREWPHQSWLKLIRRSFVEERGFCFVEGIAHEDILWTLQASLEARRVGFCDLPLYGYRSNPMSTTLNPSVAAIRRRSRSYLVIVPTVEAAALRSAGNPLLHRALMHLAHDESRKSISLLRKKLKDPLARGELAREALASSAPRLLFQGASSLREYWFAARGLVCLLAYVVIFHIAKRVGR